MATTGPDVAETILALERAALQRWGQGDPEGFLEISAPAVTYFDPFTDRRLDGIAALRALYGQLRGKIRIDHFEIVDPRVQVAGDGAVLTYRFKSYGGEGSMHWNTTEVYQRDESGWKIIHTHWALHRPRIAS
jgi:ketosteroid isomerase-like protein